MWDEGSKSESYYLHQQTSFMISIRDKLLNLYFIKNPNHGPKLLAHGRPPKKCVGPAHPMVFSSKNFSPWAELGWAGLGWAGRSPAHPEPWYRCLRQY